MYPDLSDVKRTIKTLNLAADAKAVFSDAVWGWNFLRQSTSVCKNHGRHRFMPLSELKTFAESFIGHSTSDDSLKIAIKIFNLTTKTSDGLLVKLPPLARFEENRELWAAYVGGVGGRLDTEIAAELAAVESRGSSKNIIF